MESKTPASLNHLGFCHKRTETVEELLAKAILIVFLLVSLVQLTIGM